VNLVESLDTLGDVREIMEIVGVRAPK